MEPNEKMTYLAIPDEACYIVDIDNNEKFNINDVAENTTCICFKDTNASHINQILNLLPDLKDKYLKTAWFTDRKSIPFKAELFNYVKVSDILYMNITEGHNPRYIDITDKIIKTPEMVDPMSVFYFDMYNEFKNKK